MIRTKYCGTAAKAGGNGENKPHPTVKGVSCLLTRLSYLTDEKGILHETRDNYIRLFCGGI